MDEELTKLPEELNSESDLIKLWTYCAEEGAFSDGKTNLINVYVRPKVFARLLNCTMGVPVNGVWHMGGGYYIKFIVKLVNNYEIEGFGHYNQFQEDRIPCSLL